MKRSKFTEEQVIATCANRTPARGRRIGSPRKSAAVHASVSNHLNQKRGRFSRPLLKANRAAAFAEWRGLCAA
jgi:putative transposase